MSLANFNHSKSFMPQPGRAFFLARRRDSTASSTAQYIMNRAEWHRTVVHTLTEWCFHSAILQTLRVHSCKMCEKYSCQEPLHGSCSHRYRYSTVRAKRHCTMLTGSSLQAALAHKPVVCVACTIASLW